MNVNKNENEKSIGKSDLVLKVVKEWDSNSKCINEENVG